MSVYEKLMKVQHALLGVELKKNGYNPYGKFNHYTIEDLQVPILKECYKEGLLIEFSFSNDVATIKLREVSNPDFILANSIPMPKMEKLAKMNWAQTLGSYLTYMKKYLLLNTFLISENEGDIDALAGADDIEDVTPSAEFHTADKDKNLSDYANSATCISAIKKWIANKGKEITNEKIQKRALYLYQQKKIEKDMYEEIKNACEGDEAL